MNNEQKNLARESIMLRVLWMIGFAIVWQLAELVLAAVVVVQLGYRLFVGTPSTALMSFGDSLSQYLAQIGRFGTFNTEEKPWPFADWPTPRAADSEHDHAAPAVEPPASEQESKL